VNSYVSGGYEDPAGYTALNDHIKTKETTAKADRIFYLALPPSVFIPVTQKVKDHCESTRFLATLISFYFCAPNFRAPLYFFAHLQKKKSFPLLLCLKIVEVVHTELHTLTFNKTVYKLGNTLLYGYPSYPGDQNITITMIEWHIYLYINYVLFALYTTHVFEILALFILFSPNLDIMDPKLRLFVYYCTAVLFRALFVAPLTGKFIKNRQKSRWKVRICVKKSTFLKVTWYFKG